MDLLLDTHALIWFLNGDENLSKKVREEIENPKNNKFVSVASIWELAIKISLNKFQYPKGLPYFLQLIEDNGFDILPLTFEHAIVVSGLEFIHRDPFDRLLVAQTISDKLVLATKDEAIKKYKVTTIW
ncbi:MAG: type II toxin-antitoxin system VapC family toxin [Bacteroidetes bacterium]|nr:type II toxin-antitoxin system VapC family toxin [Bacteroidota bacterium]